MAAWQDIPWKKIQRHVFRLQKRIYQATQHGRVRTARKLQQLLVKSWYARLLAVRRVTQDNRGRLLLDSRGVDVPMVYNLTFIILSSLKPLFFNSLKNESRFLGNVGA